MSEELERSKYEDQSLTVDLEVQPQETPIDGQVSLRAIPSIGQIDEYTYSFSVQIDPPTGPFQPIEAKDIKDNVARWRAKVQTPRSCLARVEITRKAAKTKEKGPVSAERFITITQDLPTSDDVRGIRVNLDNNIVPPTLRGPSVPLTLQRASSQATDDQRLWEVIRDRTDAISFPRYKRFIDEVMCSGNLPPQGVADIRPAYEQTFESRLPFPGVAAYNLLKVATEYFLMQECGVTPVNPNSLPSDRLGRFATLEDLLAYRQRYLVELEGERIIPYFSLIREKLSEISLKPLETLGPDCYGILRSRISGPCLLELIWSYWHEEGMQIQAMNAINYRFQNRRVVSEGRDPLAHLDIDPLRGLSNLLWGYVQDEQHRLSVMRRVYEYDHEYGLRLYGKAVPNVDSVDSRSKFLEAFHNLLYRTALFFKEDDDTTIIADGFEILNALREVHLLLAHGAHNQFGDLPSNARQEMLMEQWLLARPEMREFLGGKVMVPYAEPWMDRIDTVKSLFNWTDVSITYFHDLAVHGEQIVLSVRYGNWSQINDAASATNWARFWRPEIQRYIHAYRTVTGVDLTLEMVDAGRSDERYVQPSVHLRNRLAQQRSAGALPPADRRALGPAGRSTLGRADSLTIREHNR
jgi:hypothetical protein